MQLICLDEQHFAKIRESKGIYVDKTQHFYNCFKSGTFFLFLALVDLENHSYAPQLLPYSVGKKSFLRAYGLNKVIGIGRHIL